MDSEEAITKLKLEAEQDMAILKKQKEAAKKAKLLGKKQSELAYYQVSESSNLKQKLEII